MYLQQWQLPGPSRFVSRVGSDLKQGKNIALCVPSLSPGDLLSAISSSLEKSWRWTKHVPSSDLPPLAQLGRHLPLEDKVTEVQDLTSRDNLEGLVVAVDLNSRSRTDWWRDFLNSYSEHLKDTDSLEGPRFILQFSGNRVLEAPGSQVRLSVRKWENVTREIDVRHVAEQEMESLGLAPLQHQLAVEMIVRLALWDMQLAVELSRLSIEEISNPVNHLEKYGEARGWKQGETATWFDGTQATFLGEKQVHSALCAIRGDVSTIESRVWAAQTAVMFPFLEARLRDLIQGLDCLPDSADVSTDGDNEIVDKEEFELSDVHQEIQRDGRASPELRAIVGKLKRIRNRIAHRELLRVSDLKNSFSRFAHEVDQH